jgi:23S rRNA pseudouridine1911/1915/1917 synthase
VILLGLVVFAKNEYIQECLIRQMMSHDFKKEYIAVLDGIVDKKSGTINAKIARKENSIIEREINENGETAVSHYVVLEINKELNISIVEFTLETGRTHQIRLHSKYIGYPIIGDTLYEKESNLISRQALHSHKISFIHPITKKQIEYVAPMPDDMKKFVN